MAGPLGFGVYKGLAAQRARRTARRPAPRSAGDGWGVFVVTTLCLSWLTAGLLPTAMLPADAPLTSRLLTASVAYAAIMGWQPLCAAWLARRWRDDASTRPPIRARWRDSLLALAMAAGLALAAMAIALLVGERAPTVTPATGAALAGVVAVAVLCLQALTEEYGWRGEPLVYAVERWGPRAGLAVHGIAWGAWYAPLFVFATPNPRESLVSAAGFLITCLLLGIVLGWLRLRSRSILPSALANALLTIVAGLPLLLHASSLGVRDAVFRWPGWPVLAIVALVITRRRFLEPHAPPSS